MAAAYDVVGAVLTRRAGDRFPFESERLLFSVPAVQHIQALRAGQRIKFPDESQNI
jgi:hypothetical protein